MIRLARCVALRCSDRLRPDWLTNACVRLRRYALDVNAERADDVVTHQRLLQEARDPERRPALSVRVVQVRNPSLRRPLELDPL